MEKPKLYVTIIMHIHFGGRNAIITFNEKKEIL